MDIEEDWDFLYIYDGPSDASEELSKISSTALASVAPVETTQSSMHIKWVADDMSEDYAGWTLTWENINAEPVPTFTPTATPTAAPSADPTASTNAPTKAPTKAPT